MNQTMLILRLLSLLASGALLVCAGVPASARAAPPHTFTYTVEHPTYGDIGTYTDTVAETGKDMQIDTRMRIAVKVLGIVVHREDADRTEIWHGDRLVSFHSATTTNGKTLVVDGRAQGDKFIVTSPAGRATAPADVEPSSPWAVRYARPGVMMSTKTGELFPSRILGAGRTVVSVDGIKVPVRHFTIQTDTRDDVWLSHQGVPVRFRTEVDGTPINFVLTPQDMAALGASRG